MTTSFTVFIYTSLLVLLPTVHFLSNNANSTRTAINVILALQCLSTIYSLVVIPPPNIFSKLGIPLGAPTERIRSLLLQNVEGRNVPKSLEQLLTRIGSFETRTYYVRFGHDVVANCEWCQSFNDFALYSLPGFLQTYILEAAILGLVTIRGSGKERYRTFAIGGLLLAAVAELYWFATVNIKIPPVVIPRSGIIPSTEPVIMWWDLITQARTVLFFLGPFAIHAILPSRPPGNSLAPTFNASPAAQQLQMLITKVQLAKYVRGAVFRQPNFLRSAQHYWYANQREGQWVRGDPFVQEVARKTGFGFDEYKDEDSDDGDKPQPENTVPENNDPNTRLRRNAETLSKALLDAILGGLPRTERPP